MPLATILRPKTLEEFIGQKHLVGEDAPLRKLIENENIPSMIFWGPPASGKTTLAEIIANSTNSDFIRLSAVMDGKDNLKKVLKIAKENKAYEKSTILFIDEIHRWNKAQQDALLPHIESGDIILIGATTENPSFTVISPLISRSRVFIFSQHNEKDIYDSLIQSIDKINQIIENPSKNNLLILKNKIKPIKFDKDSLELLSNLSNGDMRFAINSIEVAINLLKDDEILTKEIVSKVIQKTIRYDKDGEEHYNIISAVHKSLRSSNPTAACYWIMRMLEAGDDPLYVARRLLRFASEDIGNANTNALLLANQVYDTCHKLGMPECDTALMQLAEYLANSPKNNRSYVASHMAREDVKQYGNLPVPMHLRNAPTSFMRDIGYGKGYEYDHDLKSKKSEQQCMPDEIKDKNYFE